MSVVTITDAWPKPGEPFAVSDLDRMPDDGHRYELLDGALIVSPAPGLPHQRVAVTLCHALELACPDDLIVFPNVSMRIGARSALEPDAVVARQSDVGGVRLTKPPLLVAEIVSPDSACGISTSRRPPTSGSVSPPTGSSTLISSGRACGRFSSSMASTAKRRTRRGMRRSGLSGRSRSRSSLPGW
jgi:hypothetical protein